jgi:DNA mismatch repair protein MutL
MARIRRLPTALANQIAAGEVVERPASVVKELVENALDAGALRIAITIEHGGKTLVRVEDDGHGMESDDARLALERHATSKIACAEDLAAIATLGFRGEALPSIGSVSRLRLLTRARGRSIGTEVRIEAGVMGSIREAGAPEGTLVEVADLFYNLPARRKFLKSDAAEGAQVSRLVTQLALSHHDVGVRLLSAGRWVLQCPATRTLAERFFQLHGERSDLVEVRKEAAGVRVYGYVAALAEQGPVRGPQNVFVNGRIVRDRTIAHAISEAYRAATIKERSPEVHLFIELPPERVDVNVHPTKAEVRFLEPSLVHEVVRRALGDALGRSPTPALQLTVPVQASDPVARGIPGLFSPAMGSPLSRETSAAALAMMRPAEGIDAAGPEARGSSPAEIAPMVPLGQFRETFIIAVDADGIAIVDQHVAHERVLFEQVLERLGTGPLASQRLLQPLIIEFGADERQALVARARDLARFGLEIEPFGGNALQVLALPAMLPVDDCAATLKAVAGDLDGLDRDAPADVSLGRVAATMACHAAVKANMPLTMEKMRYILDELRRTAYSTVCPHGRPVVLRLSRREIEKNFQRI